jgi:hypothetical protein
MKLMTALFLLTTSTIALADTGFSPIAVCGNRSLVIDSRTITYQTDRGGRTRTDSYYQVVLKNDDVVRDFISKGAIGTNEVNSKGEFLHDIVRESQNKFYGVSTGRTTTVEKVGEHSLSLKTFAPAQYGSYLMADFTFNDCQISF